MKLYEKYKRLNLDTSWIGLEPGSSRGGYFCTPKGARVFGWEGGDGIHYCFIKGYDDMVFAVNPTNSAGQYVYPLAGTFEDFLRLILACKSAGTVEQIHGWSEEQFHEFLSSEQLPEEQKAVLEQIQTVLKLCPMENPFSYVRELQKSFDYSSLQFSKEYYDTLEEEETQMSFPQWKVYYNGNFWGHGNRREKPGTEIPVNRELIWGHETWRIPSVYACGAGLVVDFCVRIKPEQIQAFLNQWYDPEQNEEEAHKEWGLTAAENPLNVDIQPYVVLNGKELSGSHMCAVSWNPCLPENCSNDPEAQMVLEHYGCDPTYGWVFLRAAFAWATKRRPVIHSLSLTLKQNPVPFPGLQFTADKLGQRIDIVHPITGQKHVLTVIDCVQDTFPEQHLSDDSYEWPRCYTQMTYTLSPDLSDQEFSLRDCEQGDSPRPKKQKSCHGVAAVSVIGGADGPTAIFICGRAEKRQHTAYSSMHFEPAASVKWRSTFYEKMRADIHIEIWGNEEKPV